jgi:molybdopterin synthase sulfur carrier subunit
VSKTITILYFAQLAAERGLDSETRTGDGHTALDWFEEISTEHKLSLPAELVRPAVNGSYCAWETLVPDGATLAFIPPVSGG